MTYNRPKRCSDCEGVVFGVAHKTYGGRRVCSKCVRNYKRCSCGAYSPLEWPHGVCVECYLKKFKAVQ